MYILRPDIVDRYLQILLLLYTQPLPRHLSPLVTPKKESVLCSRTVKSSLLVFPLGQVCTYLLLLGSIHNDKMPIHE